MLHATVCGKNIVNGRILYFKIPKFMFFKDKLNSTLITKQSNIT